MGSWSTCSRNAGARNGFYQDLKGELGLDHFEGRRYLGWHHHVSVALACFAFVAAERARGFPPSAVFAQEDGAVTVAA
jgi:SRSO17 transposase